MALQTEVTLLDLIRATSVNMFGTEVAISGKIGEKVASPEQYTIMDRLKIIGENGGTGINQQYSRPAEFEISCEITRSANTTAYAINQIIGGTGETTMALLDFSVLGSIANRPLQINCISLISSNGGASTKLNPIIHLANASTFTGQTQTDTTAFNPTYAETIAKDVETFEGLTTTVNHGTNYYKISKYDILRNCKLNASSQLYCAIIAGSAYTPSSSEKITILLKGYLL